MADRGVLQYWDDLKTPVVLGDLQDIDLTGVAEGEVMTRTDEATFGFAPVPAPDPGTPYVAAYPDDGTFSDGATFDFTASITVAPKSTQLVTITAHVTSMSADYPWNLTAYDLTTDPSSLDPVGNNGFGDGAWAQCELWAVNTTTGSVSHDIAARVAAAASAGTFTADVEVTIRTAYFY